MAIGFDLTPAQASLQLASRKFARNVLRDVASTVRHLPTPFERFAATRPFYEELVRQGFLRRLIPEPFGGDCTSMVDMAVIAEEFHACDANVSLTALANILGLTPIMLGGSDELRARYIAPFLETKGALLACFASSEPGGSANFASPLPGEGVRTTATLDNGQWVITGAKQWISSACGWDGKGADLLSVVCRTHPTEDAETALSVIAVPGRSPGFAVDKIFDTMGHRAHITPRFSLKQVRVPNDNLIGSAGGGKALVDQSFSDTAALVGIMATGLLRAAFDATLQFAKMERRGGVSAILNHQAVGYALADAKMALEAVRSLSYRACWAQDMKVPGALELALHAKVFGSETAVRVICDLMRVMGIDSYSYDQPLAELLQDAIALPLFDGGNMGVRRRQLHSLMLTPDYDSLTASTTAVQNLV